MNAIVAGGAGGIGRAVALRLNEEGARVVAAVDRQANALPDGLISRAHDISQPDAAAESFKLVSSEYCTIDPLVSCTGIVQAEPLKLSKSDWSRILDVNLVGKFLCMHVQAAWPMLDAGSGAIVNLSSIAALGPRPDFAHDAASKASVTSLTHSPALAFAPKVRVNALCPGVIETVIWTTIDRERGSVQRLIPGKALRRRRIHYGADDNH